MVCVLTANFQTTACKSLTQTAEMQQRPFRSLFDVSPVQPVTNFGFLLQPKHKHTGYFESVGVTMSVCISLAYDLSWPAKTKEHFLTRLSLTLEN